MKILFVLTGLISVLVVQVVPGEGAELRYIRIGEHKAYTRIVFEFQGPGVFKEPVVQGKGAFYVAFENTTTALPEEIVSETSKRVDLIKFVRERPYLVANITVTFPYFDIKSFGLQNPDRVVLDVSPLSEPPPEPMFQEKTDKTVTAGPVSGRFENPAVRSGKEAKADAEVRADQSVATPEEAGLPERSKAVEPTSTAQVLVSQSQAEASHTANTDGPAAMNATPPRSLEEPASRELPPVVPWAAQPTGGRLQTMLLVVLLGISVVIVGLLAVIVFRKKPVAVTKDGLVEMADDHPQDDDDGIEAIDAKLRKALNRIG